MSEAIKEFNLLLHELIDFARNPELHVDIEHRFALDDLIRKLINLNISFDKTSKNEFPDFLATINRDLKNILKLKSNYSLPKLLHLVDRAISNINSVDGSIHDEEFLSNKNRYHKELSLKKEINSIHEKLTRTQGELNEKTQELEKFKIEVSKKLSDDLTSTFSERAKKVEKHKKNMSIALIIASILTFLITLFAVFPEFLYHLYPSALNKQTDDIALSIFKRTVLIIISYVMLAFIIRQYNKEREIEEAYRFKEAIAFSIPKYREIANDTTVKDRLLEESARVIFEHPHERKQRYESKIKEPDFKESLNLFEQMSNIFKRINKD